MFSHSESSFVCKILKHRKKLLTKTAESDIIYMTDRGAVKISTPAETAMSRVCAGKGDTAEGAHRANAFLIAYRTGM